MPLLSVVAPVGRSLDTVRRQLFEAFTLETWLALGFTAWLASLMEGYVPQWHFGSWSPFETPVGRQVLAWGQAHLVLVITVGAGLALAGLAGALALTWVRCRGKFMFLDNVLNNRAEVAAPWRRFARQGNSLFLFTVAFGLGCLAVAAAILGMALAVAWPDLARHTFGANALGALVLGGLCFLCFLVAAAGVWTYLEDFVIPLMVLRACGAMDAWAAFLDLFRGHAGAFVLYLLVRWALGLAVGAAEVLLCCCCCGVVLVPYLGAVLLLPLHVFWRSYSVHFLEQAGPAFRLFRGNPSSYLTV